MNNTAVAPSAYAVTGVKPITLNLKNISWVGHKNKDASLTFEQKNREAQQEASKNFGADDEEAFTTKEDWRKIIVSPPGSDPDEPFPETDSNGNPCRILDHDPKTNTWTQSESYAYVTYPDGHQRILPTVYNYNQHINSKMCHFALAAIAAWPAGEARPFPDSWRGNTNAATAITPTMWDRACIHGYLKVNDLDCLRAHAKRIRTDKPVDAKIRRSRKLKSSAWPFSEKEHWFHVMSGALQITNSNMTQTLCGQSPSADNRRERDLIKKTFPVFAAKAEFKRARKFLENLSIKKNEKANRTDPGTEDGMDWDPLKVAYQGIGGGLHSTMQSNQNLLSTPYKLVKTSLMLGCVPEVSEDGSITDYKQITSDYISELQNTQPMTKSVIGTWNGCHHGWQVRKPGYSTSVCNSVNVNNLTHMYMLLLNEVRLLSNDALVRWADHQSLTTYKIDFDADFLQNCNYDIFGYKLTDTLDYSCIVWTTDRDSTN